MPVSCRACFSRFNLHNASRYSSTDRKRCNIGEYIPYSATARKEVCRGRSKNVHYKLQHRRLPQQPQYSDSQRRVVSILSGPLLCRLRHLVTGSVQVSLQRVHSRITLPTVLAHVFDRRVLALIVTLAVVWTGECGPTYATGVGRGRRRRRGRGGGPIPDR